MNHCFTRIFINKNCLIVSRQNKKYADIFKNINEFFSEELWKLESFEVVFNVRLMKIPKIVSIRG